MDVASEDAGDHGVDQDPGRFVTDAPAGEAVDGFVLALGARAGEGLAQHPQPPGEAQHRAGEEGQRSSGQLVQAAAAVEEALGGVFVRRLELAFEAKTAHQGRGGGHVVEIAVGTPLHGETVEAIGADVAAGAVAAFQHRHLEPARDLGGAVFEVERRGQARNAAADHYNPFHVLVSCVQRIRLTSRDLRW